MEALELYLPRETVSELVKMSRSKITTLGIYEDRWMFKDFKTRDEKKLSTFLSTYMTRVLLGKAPSPIYEFEDPREENTDNDWWGHTPAWSLMVALNYKGFITVESEDAAPGNQPGHEGKYENASGLIYVRAVVTGIMLKETAEKFCRLVNIMGCVAYGEHICDNDEDIVLLMQKINRKAAVFPITRSEYYHGETKFTTRLMTTDINMACGGVLRNLSLECRNVLQEQFVCVTVFDPTFNRSADKFLFPTLLAALRSLDLRSLK
jgi:hypothetical protein